MATSEIRKLNVGCGHDIRTGYVNLDVASLPGVDVVHDLAVFPWPFGDDAFDEVLMMSVLEHLPNVVGTIEEVWRICRDGARVAVCVPHWNSRTAWLDPTHIRPFDAETFDFFDPEAQLCRTRPYYSRARFRVEAVTYHGFWFRRAWPWTLRVTRERPRRQLMRFLTSLPDIVHYLDFELRAIKKTGEQRDSPER
jgi:SAM-dependent methyltransferase